MPVLPRPKHRVPARAGRPPPGLYAFFMRPVTIAHGGFAHSGSIYRMEGIPMLDILLFALGLGLFGLMAAYTLGCGRI